MSATVFLKSKACKRGCGSHKANKGRLRNAFFFAAAITVLALVGCRQEKTGARLPYYNTADFTPLFFRTSAEAQAKVTHTLASFSLADQDGKTISNETVKGKVHVANFMFTSCGSICPRMTDNLAAVSKAFATDSSVVLLSYSVTPWIDNADRLKQYKADKGITNRNWHFLTGDKGRIYTLARQSYFAEEDLGFTRDSSEFLHTEHLLLVDGSGRIRGIYNGTLPLEVEQLIADIRTLKKESQP